MSSKRNTSSKTGFRLKFDVKLILMFLIAIVVVSGILTYQNMNSTKTMFKKEMQQLGFSIADGVSEKIQLSGKVQEKMEEMAADRIYQACQAVNLLPLNEMSNEKVTEIAKKLKVDGGISIIGPDRKVIYSDNLQNIGWEYAADHPMTPVFNGSQTSYMEGIRADMLTGEMVKYGGIALDQPGYYIQVGIKATTISELMSDFSANKLLKDVEKNEDVIYAVMINTDGVAYAGTESMVKDEPYTDQVTMNAVKNGIRGSNYWENKETGVKAYDVQIPYYDNGELKGSICVGITLKRMEVMLAENSRYSIIFTAGLCVLGAIVFLIIISLFLKPLRVLASQLAGISKGDFTIQQDKKVLEQKDDLGAIARAVQIMREELGSLITGLRGDATDVEESSDTLSQIMRDTTKVLQENAQAIESLANSASEQSEEVDKVARSADELSINVEKGQTCLHNASQQVDFVSTISKDGENIIEDLEQVTNESISRTEAVSKGVSEINETVLQMKDFMGRIRAISEQTNMLALNSSIEAARAGAAGKGFAVIGEQIRKLADETKQTTEQVEATIGEITFRASTAAEHMITIGEVNGKQTYTLKETLDIFSKIQGSVKELTELMGAVVETNDAVSGGKDSILDAVGELSALTQNLSAACEEISASTEEQLASVEEVNELSKGNKDISKKLADNVNRFKTE